MATSGKTLIFCAHRLSSITEVEKIHVLNEGSVVQQGTHKELLTQKGKTYAKMWDSYNSGGFKKDETSAPESNQSNIQSTFQFA